MPATIHVVARYLAKSGKEDTLRQVLTTLVPPTRRELGCYQYDLLVNAVDPRDLCLIERWDDDVAIDGHLATEHVRTAFAQVEELVESPPDIRRYRLV